MRRDRLLCLSYATLERLADRMEVEYAPGTDQEELVELLLEVIQENREEWERQTSAPLRFEEKKFDLPPEDVLELTEPEDAHFPEAYAETRIRALLRDPEWAYAYWDLHPTVEAEYEKGSESGGLRLRVLELPEADPVSRSQPLDTFDIDVRLEDRSWYFNLPRQDTIYLIELVSVDDNRVLAVSNLLHVPRSGVAGDEATRARPILQLSGVESVGPAASSEHNGRRGMSLIGELYGR